MTGCYIVCESITLWIASFLANPRFDDAKRVNDAKRRIRKALQTQSGRLKVCRFIISLPTSHFSLLTPHFSLLTSHSSLLTINRILPN